MSLLQSIRTSLTVRGVAIALGAWFAEAAIKRLVGVAGFELQDTVRVLLYTTLELAMVGGVTMFAAGIRRAIAESGPQPQSTVAVSVPADGAPTTVVVSPPASPKEPTT